MGTGISGYVRADSTWLPALRRTGATFAAQAIYGQMTSRRGAEAFELAAVPVEPSPEHAGVAAGAQRFELFDLCRRLRNQLLELRHPVGLGLRRRDRVPLELEHLRVTLSPPVPPRNADSIFSFVARTSGCSRKPPLADGTRQTVFHCQQASSLGQEIIHPPQPG
jgi:hypothetical protein